MKRIGAAFDDFSVGGAGAAWRDIFKDSYMRAGATFSDTIESSAGRMTMTVVPTSNVVSKIFHVRSFADSAVGDFEISGILTSNSANLGPGVIGMWNGDIASANGYSFVITTLTGSDIKSLALVRWDAGVGTSLGTITAGLSSPSCRFRFRVANGSVSAKIWAVDSAESTSTGWMNALDVTYSSGRVGVMAMSNSGFGTANDYCTVDEVKAYRVSTVAVAPVILTSGVDAVDKSSFTTASVALDPTKGYILVVGWKGTAPVLMPSSVTGCNATWNNVAGTDSTTATSVTAWQPRFDAGKNPTTGTITINLPAVATGAMWALIEVPGFAAGKDAAANNIGSYVQNLASQTTGNVTSKTITFPTAGGPDPHRAMRFAVLMGAGTANSVAPSSGWTEIHESSMLNPTSTFEIAYCMDLAGLQASCTHTWTTQSTGWQICFEWVPALSAPAIDGSLGGLGLQVMGSQRVL